MKLLLRTLLPALAAAPLLASASCVTKAPAGADGGPAASAVASTETWLSRRDPSLRPPKPVPPVPGASVAPVAIRPPDWDLDDADAARDYVRRYVFFTKRYGESGLACADLGASQPAGDRRRVEVKVAPACPAAGTVRDVFLVDLASDRLTVDDKAKRDPLARWPDGSDPEAPPSEAIHELDDLRKWTGALGTVLRQQLLVPVRVQTYGRGTYPVISLAGWHGAVQAGASAEALHPLADQWCQANVQMPLGILSAMDRTRLLRVSCPGGATRWDSL